MLLLGETVAISALHACGYTEVAGVAGVGVANAHDGEAEAALGGGGSGALGGSAASP